MALRYRLDFLQHLFSIRGWVQLHAAQSTLDPLTLALRVSRERKEAAFHPQFVCKQNGKLFYSPDFRGDVVGFCGWFPYALRNWDLAGSKISFKQWLGRAGLPTPAYWFEPNHIDAPYIVKKSISSFGYGIRGPYLPEDGEQHAIPLEPGEFFEKLITGRIARAWFWNDRLVTLEMFDMPRVCGDGHSTLLELVRSYIGADAAVPAELHRIARIQRLTLETIIPEGDSAIADFRYVSALNPTIYGNFNQMASPEASPVVAYLQSVGPTLWKAVPYELRSAVAYVVDAIVDDEGQVHFLEMNSNPQLHPDLYPVVLDSLLSPAGLLSKPLPNWPHSRPPNIAGLRG